MNLIDWSRGRLYIQYMSPSAKKFLVLSTNRVERFMSASAYVVSFVMPIAWTWNFFSEWSSSGFVERPAILRFFSVNASSFTMIVPPSRRIFTFVTSAAGFIATSTSQVSPGVRMSVLPNLIWNPLTP